MTKDEIELAVAQVHYGAYVAAINEGKTSTQAMQIADTTAAIKRHVFNNA